jgi:recombination protein RecA
MSDELRRFLANATAPAKIESLDELGARRGALVETRWSLAALRGRLVELSARGASASLSCAFDLVIEAQAEAEPVAWLTVTGRGGSTFYPPDVAALGVDLAALVVVRAPDALACARAAERLLRSGAFGLVVLDLVQADLSMPVQGRLVTLAQSHDAAVVCLTDKPCEAPSLGSLVSLRAQAVRLRDREGAFRTTISAIKDKRRGPGWTHASRRKGPPGMI